MRNGSPDEGESLAKDEIIVLPVRLGASQISNRTGGKFRHEAAERKGTSA